MNSTSVTQISAKRHASIIRALAASACAALIASPAVAAPGFMYLDDFNTPFAGSSLAGRLTYGQSEVSTLTTGAFDTRLATYNGSTSNPGSGPTSNNAQVRAGLGGFFVGETGEGILQYNVGDNSNRNVIGSLLYTDSNGPVDLTGAISITSELYIASSLLDGLPASYTISVSDSFGVTSTATGTLGAAGDIISIDLVASVSQDGLDLSSVEQIAFTFDWTGVEQADSIYSAIRINTIPTPASAMLLGLGGLVVNRRRR